MKFQYIIVYLIFTAMLVWPAAANAADDMDWHWGEETIHSQGPDTPTDGKLWGIAVVKGDIQITFRLEAKTDMSDGLWIGDIRAPEKFYVKFRVMDYADRQVSFKIEGAKAVGPDAQYGRWKDGPATTAQQAMTFDFNWGQALKLKGNKAMIINYSRADNKDESVDIVIPLANYGVKLSEMEAAIRAVPGSRKFLMTDAEIRSMPINKLPPEIGRPVIKQLTGAAEFLGRNKNELMKLSITAVEDLIADKNAAKREVARAEKKAEHQAIYDQEPDWRDLNVCPKPDVSECGNIGSLGYEIDDMFNEEYDYGKIVGVVWRSEGSIVHIYGGSLDYGLEPEIVRAKSAKYYYVMENDEGYIKIRPAKTMLLR